MNIPQIVVALEKIRSKFRDRIHHIELRITSDGTYSIIAVAEDKTSVVLSYRQVADETIESFLSAVTLASEHPQIKEKEKAESSS